MLSQIIGECLKNIVGVLKQRVYIFSLFSNFLCRRVKYRCSDQESLVMFLFMLAYKFQFQTRQKMANVELSCPSPTTDTKDRSEDFNGLEDSKQDPTGQHGSPPRLRASVVPTASAGKKVQNSSILQGAAMGLRRKFQRKSFKDSKVFVFPRIETSN